MSTKTCTKCKQELPVTEFNNCKHTRDKLQSWCKACTRTNNRERQQANRDKVNQYNREWREKYAETEKPKAKERSRKSYLKNRQAVLERTREYHLLHPEVSKRSQEKYCANNREKRRQNTRRYFAEHPEKVTEQASRRRARERRATVGDVDLEAIWIRDNGICHICGQPVLKKDVNYDHVIPLSRGGAHTMANIKVSYFRCNFIKGSRLMEELNPAWFVGIHGNEESARERYIQSRFNFGEI